uniref:IRF tryptophan pentad repeat domain-containing protein n=1 Tax=Neogobius melanostomus TaxID=47308 RepID=A0A8C6TKQ3_9GOBI
MAKDACLFQKWAIHTGKYVVGQKCNPKIWKANFRCALHSLPDVVEVKGRSVQKGQEATRVFRMLPESRKPRDRRTKTHKIKSKRKIKIEKPDSDYEESSNCPFEQSLLDRAPTQESIVDSTVDRKQQDLKMDFEVPDWSQTIEVGSDRYNFQVSPEHSPDSSDYDFNNFTITICRPAEKDACCSGLDGKGFPANELCTSPGSQWSETSSGEEIEELPRYTTLSPTLAPPAAVMWSPSLPPPPRLCSRSMSRRSFKTKALRHVNRCRFSIHKMAACLA